MSIPSNLIDRNTATSIVNHRKLKKIERGVVAGTILAISLPFTLIRLTLTAPIGLVSLVKNATAPKNRIDSQVSNVANSAFNASTMLESCSIQALSSKISK